MSDVRLESCSRKGLTRGLLWWVLLGVGDSRLAAGADGINLAALEGWNIVVAADALPSERYAAEELRDHLVLATGHTLRIAAVADRSEQTFYVGPGAALQKSDVAFSVEGMGEEDLRIVIRGGTVAIAGGRPRGTLYGVYTFLEDYLGVRFLTPEHTHVPPVGEWRLVGPVDRTFRPPLEFRHSYFGATNGDPVFAARLRCNVVPREEKFGGPLSRRLINHSFSRQIPTGRYGTEHPEYFSLYEGKRLARVHEDSRDSEPCLTHPEVLRIVTQSVLDDLLAEPERTNVSVSQNDNDFYCRCERCSAQDAREGTPMGSLLSFVNAVAEQVAVEYPNVKVGTLAYWYSRQVPNTVRPRDNVQIQLANIECSQMQPISDPASSLNAPFAKDMEAWGAVCPDICVWTYATNFHNYLLPCPNLHVIESNIRYFVAHNVRGVFFQGSGNAEGAEFSGIRNYMASRLLWDPNLSGDALRDEFVRLHYGKAAPAIQKFIDVFHENALSKRLEKNCFGHPRDYGIDAAVAERALGAIDEALTLAENDTVRARVERASIWAHRAAVGDLPVRLSGTMRLRWNRGEITALEVLDPNAIARGLPHMSRLLELCRKHGVTRWSESWSIEDALPVLRRFFALEEGESFEVR